MNQPFFSIMNALIFAVLGLFLGSMGTDGEMVTFGYLEIQASVVWAMTGVMFLMAYFSLVHLKTDRRKK